MLCLQEDHATVPPVSCFHFILTPSAIILKSSSCFHKVLMFAVVDPGILEGVSTGGKSLAYSGKISRVKIFEVDLPQNSSRIKFRGSTRLSLHLYAIIRFLRINP